MDNKKEVKNNLNLEFLLNLLKQGKSPSQISKELNISKQSINYYLKELKSNGYIKKVGYGTWEVKNITLNIQSKKREIRGHAFIWSVKLSKDIDWLKYVKSYKLIRNSIVRIIINNQKVWLGKKSITIYDNRSFYGNNSIESRKYAVQGLKLVLDTLQKELKIKLGFWLFKVCKEHYSLIKNELARQYNEKGEKLIIRDDIDGEWLWIDDSESLNELETNKLLISKNVQDWWNDNKKHSFQVTPSFLMESLNKLTSIQIENQNQIMSFSKQIKSHLKLIKTWEKESKSRTKLYEREINIRKRNSQKTLFDY